MEPELALAEISSGTAQQRAVRRVQLLNPIGPELSMLCTISSPTAARERGRSAMGQNVDEAAKDTYH